MKFAYGVLYRLENNLREYIKETMTREYGHGWWIKAPLANNYPAYKKHFNNLYFHEVISLLLAYECSITQFPATLQSQLTATIPIRNKIAHMKVLSEEEYQQLITTNIKVKAVINNNNESEKRILR